MATIILDACGTLNLYATMRFTQILKDLRHEWFIPSAVLRESQTFRQPDPADPERLVVVPIDLSPAFSSGLLSACECQSDHEVQLYLDLASQIGDDGESMGLAIAKSRGWTVLTDDKKARRVALGLGVQVIGTPETMKSWAAITNPSDFELSEVLLSIQRFANYLPNRGAVEYSWWVSSARK